MRLGQHLGRLEARPVQLDRLQQHARREVRGKGVGQALLGRQLRRKQAGAQQPDRHLGARTGHGDDGLPRLHRPEQALQLADLAREVVFGFDVVAAQGLHGGAVGAGRAAQAQVDAAGVELGQRAEGLGHDQRRVVGQHDAARADADALRAPCDMAHQHGRGRTGDAGHVVVFGQPVAGEAEGFGLLGGAQGDGEGLGHRAAFANGHQVQHGQGDVLERFHQTILRHLCFPLQPSVYSPLADTERLTP